MLSLADWRYSGSLVMLKKDLVPPKITYNLEAGPDFSHKAPHLSMHPVPDAASLALRGPDAVAALQGGDEHHKDGRIIVCSFPSGLSVLSTYAPNNGIKADSFQRRRDWDASIKAYLQGMKDKGTPVIWMGGHHPGPLTPFATLHLSFGYHAHSNPPLTL